MKSKHYYSPLLPIGIMGILLWGGGILTFSGIAVAGIIFYAIGEANLPELISFDVFYLLLCFLSVYSGRKLNFRTLTRLTIRGSQIIWSCPLYISRTISAEEIAYAEIVDMNDHYRLPLLRGDETSFLWLSSQPFPQKYVHKADCVKCKSKYIIFPYSDKVVLAISEILPQEKTGRIRSFYHRMQLNDRRLSEDLKRRKRKNRK